MDRKQMIKLLEEYCSNAYKQYCWECENPTGEAIDFYEAYVKLDNLFYYELTDAELEDLVEEYAWCSPKRN